MLQLFVSEMFSRRTLYQLLFVFSVAAAAEPAHRVYTIMQETAVNEQKQPFLESKPQTRPEHPRAVSEPSQRRSLTVFEIQCMKNPLCYAQMIKD